MSTNFYNALKAAQKTLLGDELYSLVSGMESLLMLIATFRL